tara:strand:- start:10064 stop:10447 length:384 start_codon:yes stop_codon:yes gene_type:complete
MPRKGKGQQASKTVQGQQYGQAKMQEDSQEVVALPEMQEPQMPAMRAGASPFGRASERPNEAVTAMGEPQQIQTPEVTDQQRMQMMAMLPLVEMAASQPYATPRTRNLARKMRLAVGPMKDFEDRNP